VSVQEPEMRRWLMVNTKSRGAMFPHVFKQCAALLEQLQRAMARNPKLSAATRTLQHVSDVYDELGRLMHMLVRRTPPPSLTEAFATRAVRRGAASGGRFHAPPSMPMRRAARPCRV
jgi:hypothetical protein